VSGSGQKGIIFEIYQVPIGPLQLGAALALGLWREESWAFHAIQQRIRLHGDCS
jgi:hypothetical protein